MSFQLKEVILFGHGGETRRLPFRLGRLNVITGASKTGKTALIPIIDYCLGATKCAIPFGVIRTKVAWVGLRLAVSEGEVFIGRRLPGAGKETSSDVYYKVGVDIELPSLEDLHQTLNPAALEALLTAHAGIAENLHETPEGQTRNSLSATIRHALLYCFQHQTEIDSNRHLFHKQSEEWMPQAIKDTIPYFLGAVDDDHVSRMAELRSLRHELRLHERKFAEYENIKGKGFSRATSLLSEAADLGVYKDAPAFDNWEDSVAALKRILSEPPAFAEYAPIVEGDEFERLQGARLKLSEELEFANNQLQAARVLSSDRDGYSREAGAQLSRLRSVELFQHDHDATQVSCPLCNSALAEEQAPPRVREINESLVTLEAQIRVVEERSPQMQSVLRTLEERIGAIRLRLKENREQLEAIQAMNQRIQAYKDRNARVG
ncbi:MAG: hypothetical protein HY255_02355, partial [Betaproteobacteria bacterium]|nr:hypothetical protein [Betaproteobacteria bacterium]